MSRIELVDVSIRDGNQSLWSATGLSTPQILQVAPWMDRVGFRALDYSSSTAMGVSVRTFREDPWERLRLTRELMPHTHLQFIGTGLRFISWESQSAEFMQLVYDRLVINGMSRFVVLDPMHDMDAVRESARMIRQAGGVEIVGALTYTLSAVHDDAYYAGLAAEMAVCPNIDRVYLKDPAGLLTPDRARTILPAVKAKLGGKALELHSHCTIGLSALSYMTAAELGIDALQVACGPLSNGSSLPDAQRVAANLRELGHTVDINDKALARVADYFGDLAKAEGHPVGRPQDYDAAFLRHQVAGGVMSTTRRQLRELKLEHRFDDVMNEVTQVRAELGYPIMVTPFPQMVCTQALYNILGERYGNVSDQVIRYVLGSFGRPTGGLDPNVRDRILDRPRARELASEPAPLSLAELRKRFRAGISDEELLLRATMPAEQVDAMVAAGPAKRHYNPQLRPVLKLLEGLATRPAASELAIQKPDFTLVLRGPQATEPEILTPLRNAAT